MSYPVTTAGIRGAARIDPRIPPQYVEAVLHETWGHLAPKAREIYSGFILFTHGVHGDITVIDWTFKLSDGTELDASPWLYEDMNDFAIRHVEKKDHPGAIWRFDGTFERLKNGKSRWRGKTSPMRVVYRSKRTPEAPHD